MEYPQEAGIFIGIREFRAIFPRIKPGGSPPNPEDRRVLIEQAHIPGKGDIG
jgi:hypothetical protein